MLATVIIRDAKGQVEFEGAKRTESLTPIVSRALAKGHQITISRADFVMQTPEPIKAKAKTK